MVDVAADVVPGVVSAGAVDVVDVVLVVLVDDVVPAGEVVVAGEPVVGVAGVVGVPGELVVDAAWPDVLVELEEGAGVVCVVAAGVEFVEVELVEALFDAGGLASSPLACRAVSISCCTLPTSEVTALGVPPAPSAGNAFSCFRSFSNAATSAGEGCAVSVTTSWSASAVVVHAGHS